MNTRIYPRDERKADSDPADRNVMVAKIIVAREEGKTKAQSVGEVLNGSHDLAGFDAMWDVIEAERKILLSVNPAAFDTEAGFVAALDERAKHLDTAEWLAGTLAHHDVRDWTSLQAKFASAEV